jgi:anaerobic magnesium-protoporphyrin IX monomethyl ester cyclase
MSRILFSHSYFLKLDSKQWELSQPYAPLATITAAAVMREEKQEVFLFDPMFAESADEVRATLATTKPHYFVLYDDGFNYLSKMCLTNMRHAAFEMIALAKTEGCRIIVSSSDATDHISQYMEKGADFIILGEAEQTLKELILCLEKKESPKNIPGLAFQEKEDIVKTVSRAVMRNLDSLPFPAWDLINVDEYRRRWMDHYGYFSVNMVTTRGCPYQCNWCAKPIYGNRYNSRSPQEVVTEIVFLKNLFSFDHIWFCDDIFGLKPGWVTAFAEEIKKQGVVIKYKIQSRADLLTAENYVKALALSGCETVWMGAESGSQKILDAMDKGTTVEQITQATTLLKSHHIRPSFFLQFGYPGETMDDIEATIHLVNKLLPEDIGVSISYPLPGTVFHQRVKEELKQKANWTDSDDLELMFSNTYSPGFYKQLHRYVHKNYRKHQGYETIKNLFLHPLRTNFKSLQRVAALVYYIPVVKRERKKLDHLVPATV